jgi:hypothetical protein
MLAENTLGMGTMLAISIATHAMITNVVATLFQAAPKLRSISFDLITCCYH